MNDKKISNLLEKYRWFTDGELTDRDVSCLDSIDLDWSEDWAEWEEFIDLVESKSFTLFEAKRKNEDLWATIYINFDRFLDPPVEVRLTDMASQRLNPIQIEPLKKQLRVLGRFLNSAKVRFGISSIYFRVDFEGSYSTYKQNLIIDRLAKSLNLDIKSTF